MKNTPSWLKSAIFYEVYPQSFLDTNGDGIGDIPGVIRKLDYIQSLGCNAVWLNPCFVSPFGDAGYDVSDYRKVDPRYGSNQDLIRLFKEAHKRGMKVTLDLVAGHTSVEHPWFQASASPSQNKYSNWYVWTDSAWTESTREMPLIRGFSDRNAAYMPNFFHFQPALNFGFQEPDPDKPWQLPTNHPDVIAVREEMKDIMRFWMDAGADGFRVDMASSLVKGDPEMKGTIAFWQDVRAMFDSEYPDCVLIAEWSFPKHALQAGFHMDFMIHFNTEAYTSLFRDERKRDGFLTPGTPYSHSFFDREGKGDITRFLRHFTEHFEATRDFGYISIPTGNHDLTRIRCHRTIGELKVAYAFLWSMPGVPYLYYGDEIGMRHIDGLSSKEGGFGRVGARTPMQWNRKKNAGFSTAPASKLYLPIDPSHARPNVEDQEANASSLLNHLRSMAKLRKAHPALGANGDFSVIHGKKGKYPFIFIRRYNDEKILVAVNPANRTELVKLDRKYSRLRPLKVAGVSLKRNGPDTELVMKGVSYALYLVESARQCTF
ncbi:alpha-amylase family glycosyl hydrolase [Rubellicoccus peritrichatus]|uniref:Alpha-amylase family glycosyl hydrolase n=1 Tax=Rubellicoccus peritrichatus TaxID=3080537 RepID=A0AAQ3QVQ6_9BACT|nr:alpha-amylase family glycosyl hydrolase [Puniceicoccus sp. CR14]WOO43606.1 alpha-amylase family glycosyl hydrolase [Puniceicoccus sp. CR14]